MRAVLRRIAIQGGLTALVLGVIGSFMAELALSFVQSTSQPRGHSEAAVIDGSVMKERVPLVMASWGFAFVAIGELVMHGIRSLRKPLPPPVPSQPDQAEKLLEELLAQAEAKQAQAAMPRAVGHNDHAPSLDAAEANLARVSQA